MKWVVRFLVRCSSSKLLENSRMHITLTHHTPNTKKRNNIVRNSNEFISLFFCIDCTRYDFWMGWLQHNAFSMQWTTTAFFVLANEWMSKLNEYVVRTSGWIEINALRKNGLYSRSFTYIHWFLSNSLFTCMFLISKTLQT